MKVDRSWGKHPSYLSGLAEEIYASGRVFINFQMIGAFGMHWSEEIYNLSICIECQYRLTVAISDIFFLYLVSGAGGRLLDGCCTQK